MKVLIGKSRSSRILASHRHADLKAGEADLAIRYGRGNWGLGPETPLFAETLVPVGASGALVDQDNPRAVLAQPLIHSADSFLWRSWARRHGAGYRPKASDRTLADYALAIDVVLAGLGVGLWNQGLHALPSGLTTLERFELSDPPLRYYLIQPKGRGSEAIATLVGRFVSARGRLAAIGALSAQNQSR